MEWEIESIVTPKGKSTNAVALPEGDLDIEELKQLDGETLKGYLLHRCHRKRDLQEIAKH